MIFREATSEDFEYMVTHSINQTVDRKDTEQTDYSFALEHDGKLLGIGGFRMIVPTTCWCWVDLTEDAVLNLRDSYETIRDWIDRFAKIHKIVRMQAFVKAITSHIRLVQHLGFKKEGIMEKFYGNEDAFLFVRFF